MLKKIKTIICLLIVACLSSIFVVGCSNENEEELLLDPQNCEVIVETTLYHPIDGCKDFIAICSSLDEFKKICLKNGYDFFDGSNKDKNHYDTDAGKIIRGYSDEYFENNAFVVCAFYRSAWAGQYRIEEVEVIADNLVMYVKYPRSEIAECVINNVFLIVGVEKSY